MARKTNPERRARVADLLERGLGLAEIARTLDVSIPTVWYYACGLGYQPDQKFNRRYDWDEVQRHYDAGHTVRECREHFGFANQTWNSAVRRGDVRARARAVPLDELLGLGPRRNRLNIKFRLIRAGLKEDRCEDCGISDWRGQPLSLALHHLAGRGVVRPIRPVA